MYGNGVQAVWTFWLPVFSRNGIVPFVLISSFAHSEHVRYLPLAAGNAEQHLKPKLCHLFVWGFGEVFQILAVFSPWVCSLCTEGISEMFWVKLKGFFPLVLELSWAFPTSSPAVSVLPWAKVMFGIIQSWCSVCNSVTPCSHEGFRIKNKFLVFVQKRDVWFELL